MASGEWRRGRGREGREGRYIFTQRALFPKRFCLRCRRPVCRLSAFCGAERREREEGREGKAKKLSIRPSSPSLPLSPLREFIALSLLELSTAAGRPAPRSARPPPLSGAIDRGRATARGRARGLGNTVPRVRGTLVLFRKVLGSWQHLEFCHL